MNDLDTEELQEACEPSAVPRDALVFKHFSDDGMVKFADVDEDGVRRFAMQAYSGAVITNHWFWGNVIINTAGMRIGRQAKPVLREHMPLRIVGHSETIEKGAKGKVDILGRMSQTPNSDGPEVMGLVDEGFPWQASIFPQPTVIKFLKEGVTGTVNDRKVTGPLYIFDKSDLIEASFAVAGADPNTSVKGFAAGRDIVMTFNRAGLTEQDSVSQSIQPDEVEATLEVNEMASTKVEAPEDAVTFSSLTIEQVKENAPTVAAALKAEGETDATAKFTAEQKRARDIFAFAKDADKYPGIVEAAQKAVDDGKSADVAGRELTEFKLALVQKEAAPAIGGEPGETGEPEKAKFDANSEDPRERQKAHMARGDKYQEEHKCSRADAMKFTAARRGTVQVIPE